MQEAPYPESRLLEGTLVLQQFRVSSLIAEGAQGSVYLAEDLQLNRQVALKILRLASTEESQERLKREARILASVEHPNIVKIYASGQIEDGRLCLVMEFLAGDTLANTIRRQGKLEYKEFLPILYQIISALEFLHSKQILHRDLKPENIFLQEAKDNRSSSSALRVKLVDFGIAKILTENTESNLTHAQILGTAAYMSPEQCKNEQLDVRSDIYSLACVIYEALSGKPPFEGESPLDIMYKHANETAPFLTELPDEFSRLLQKAMAKNPGERFASVAEFGTALEKIAAARIYYQKQEYEKADALLDKTIPLIKQDRPYNKELLSEAVSLQDLSKAALRARTQSKR